MAYVMLYGVGWTQRWHIAEESVPLVASAIERVGRDESSHLPVRDPGTNEPTTLVVAWRHVVAAVVLGSGEIEADGDGDGQYR